MDRTGILAFLIIGLAFCASARGAQQANLERKYAGFHMTPGERDALRNRVQAEQWAKEHFEQKVLPAARRGEPYPNALAYVVTGDGRYADRSGASLIERANRYLDLSKEDFSRLTWFWGPKQAGQPSELPLVYDLIEPLRPFLELQLYCSELNGSAELTQWAKDIAGMAQSMRIVMHKRYRLKLIDAIDVYVGSVAKAFSTGNVKHLRAPMLCESSEWLRRLNLQ